jgi:hypothetical protein
VLFSVIGYALEIAFQSLRLRKSNVFTFMSAETASFDAQLIAINFGASSLCNIIRARCNLTFTCVVLVSRICAVSFTLSSCTSRK